jgi:hypothetical protein
MIDPSSRPQNGQYFETNSLDCDIVVIDELGDTTVRPRRPNIPLDPPRPRRPQLEPPSDEPKDRS